MKAREEDEQYNVSCHILLGFGMRNGKLMDAATSLGLRTCAEVSGMSLNICQDCILSPLKHAIPYLIWPPCLN